ncbi:MAG: SDR family NAD(P)-dependent oxidoreductase [Lachnospiraceae bacterium]|nr:SDR family NAD(P)-dependent oxidoreductase [Lachnospiraceae bacterium]
MKTALITGASRGIGRAGAIELSKDYDLIAICCKENTEKLEETALSMKKNNCEVMTFTGDVSEYNFVSDMVNAIIDKYGHIDTLINNAGIASIGLFTDVTPSDWQKMLDTNLTSVYNTCHTVAPHMIHEKSGRIINVSSVWGLVGASCEVCYSATKGAINSFTKALAKELAPSNVSVNAIAFGAVDTDMNSCLTEEDKSALCEEIPFGRMASCAEAALFIKKLSKMPSYFTGEVVKFDGGWI